MVSHDARFGEAVSFNYSNLDGFFDSITQGARVPAAATLVKCFVLFLMESGTVHYEHQLSTILAQTIE
jgi:hypothetical protein